jgi:hypothetical protein
MKQLKVTGKQMQEMPACFQRIPGKEKASEISHTWENDMIIDLGEVEC